MNIDQVQEIEIYNLNKIQLLYSNNVRLTVNIQQYLRYLPNICTQFSFYAAKSSNKKKCESLYVQCEATAVLYYSC